MSAAQKVTRTLNFGAISNYFWTVIMEDPVVLVSTTVHYLGSFRSFLGEKRVETSPKFLDHFPRPFLEPKLQNHATSVIKITSFRLISSLSLPKNDLNDPK